MKRTYDCPECGAEVEVGSSDERVKCTGCGAILLVDVDADLVGESWKDLTRLVKVEG